MYTRASCSIQSPFRSSATDVFKPLSSCRNLKPELKKGQSPVRMVANMNFLKKYKKINMEGDQQAAIDKTGCGELNDLVLLCYDKHRDWRKCQPEMQAFRECYQRHCKDLEAEKKKINFGKS
jgi:hypothetical protein